jgi:hypothetical protein
VASAGAGHRILAFPDAQNQGVDWAALMVRRHTIHGLVDVDVTEARRAVHDWRRTSGEPLSFTSFVVASFAHAVGEVPSVQAVRKGRRRTIEFDDVDVAVLVEHVVEGGRVPMPHIVRAANRKTPAEIEREILAARAEAVPYAREYRFVPLWLKLPAVLRRFALTRVLADPYRRKRFTGTSAVTAVGMFGRGTGWGIPFISHSICLTVGGVGKRPGFGPDGRLEAREFLCLTVSVDHDVVNGAPLARFTARLLKSIESAALLQTARRPAPEPSPASESAAAPEPSPSPGGSAVTART